MGLQESIVVALNTLFKDQKGDLDLRSLSTLSPTRKEFDGDYTLVVFPFLKWTGKGPEDSAKWIGEYLKSEIEVIESYNVIKGFLNLELNTTFWTSSLDDMSAKEKLDLDPKNEKILVEFSSPNTNKPLHLGHIRNILLGDSTSGLLKAAGYEVINTQIINDRGIAVCKSMLAWQKFGEGKTPESEGLKGDHFVGYYYVLFENKFKAEYKAWQESEVAQKVFELQHRESENEESFYKRFKNEYFNAHSEIGGEAKEMLQKWENNDQEIRTLWSTMNQWVFTGFNATYTKLGVSFDALYYESNTYLLGKDMIQKGVSEGLFYQKEDGSIWIDLEDVGLDHKLVLRSDGTSVYMTQDIGTAELRYKDHGTKKMIYTVANEQDYHFKALFEICKKLEKPFADGLYHLSYGMVDLPSGKMKSREGTVVDADDLIQEVIDEAKRNSLEREVQLNISESEQNEIYRKVGLGALKYFILKINPKKRIVFDPKESVDMQGDTGPYIQNAYVRIKSVERKLKTDELDVQSAYTKVEEVEKEIIQLLLSYPALLEESASKYDPSEIAAHAYVLAKSYHKFYHDIRILKAETDEAKLFRLNLSSQVAKQLKHAFEILGIEMPEKM